MKQIKSPKFSKPVFTCGDGLRFATPEVVGLYRAVRLKCSVLADISCGIGGRPFALQRNAAWSMEWT